MVNKRLNFKIDTVQKLIDLEYEEIVRLEIGIENGNIAVAELPDNGEKEKVLEELQKNNKRFQEGIEDREKSIEIMEKVRQKYQDEVNTKKK